ncbi:sensor histidine kinase [Kitasatospora purpeofusca]|uniref:sensor histidine kinase n=1 Tax=Kitasatospora purpeofusca TaxID=67352 RepID=UPI002A59CAC5|nr:histidine kinase [Kitasatospora purpeofusca]MDY0811094.1 histidine kinase [Kitasatospora purpeofusca]
MPRILAPLLASATYARWLHLLTGWIFAGVILMIYPGTYHKSLTEILAESVAVDVVLLALIAMLPAVRRVEGIQARLLLVPDREEDITAEPARTWADRWRTATWLIGRIALGSAAGVVSVFTFTVLYDLLIAPKAIVVGVQLAYLERSFWYLPVIPLLVFGYGWLMVWAGRLQLAMAVGLLGPSREERMVEAELRAEQLLERNRLARELHDSIGHAMTVTILQASAARAVDDGAFVARALEVIEETGRQAMEDLERTLVLLREGTEGTAIERPGVEQLPEFIDAVRAAGSLVEASIDVPPGRLPKVLSHESYRIVQEGVTNALKYAPGEPIRIRIAVREGQLELRCANAAQTGGVPRPTGSASRFVGTAQRNGGKGLRGIRERAALLGGEATAGPESGEWVLAVRMPLRLGA